MCCLVSPQRVDVAIIKPCGNEAKDKKDSNNNTHLKLPKDTHTHTLAHTYNECEPKMWRWWWEGSQKNNESFLTTLQYVNWWWEIVSFSYGETIFIAFTLLYHHFFFIFNLSSFSLQIFFLSLCHWLCINRL